MMFMRKNRAGLLICTVMLIVLSTVMAGGCSVFDKDSNRWDFDRGEVAEAIAEKDAGALYEFLAPYMLEKTDLTEDDLQEFLDKCDIENTSSKDMDRYTSFKFLREIITGRTGTDLLTRCTTSTMMVHVFL